MFEEKSFLTFPEYAKPALTSDLFSKRVSLWPRGLKLFRRPNEVK